VFGLSVAQLKTQQLQKTSLFWGGGVLTHLRNKVRLFWAIMRAATNAGELDELPDFIWWSILSVDGGS
jgi:hypothetical protein